MSSKVKKRAVMIAAVIVLLLAGIYFGVAVYYQSHFLPRTTLNDMDVSGKTQEEVEAMITEEIDGYELTLKERGGKEEIIKGTEISLKPEFGTTISGKIEEQNAYKWLFSFRLAKEFEETTVVSFSRKKLKAAVKALDCMQDANQIDPKDAYCSDYTESGYQIIPEEQGSKIIEEKLLSVLAGALGGLLDSVSLEDKDCYEKPKITTADTNLVNLVDTLNKYTGARINYELGGKTEILDGSTTHTWMIVNDYQVSIDEEAVDAYATSLRTNYNTAFRGHTLKTSYGTTVTINDGDYGWTVDKDGEKAQIIEDIKSGESIDRELVYSRRAASHGENDYGDTYVEINLTAQHLFFYKNGSLIVESDFVSGNVSKNYDTPTGVYGLTYKERNATLKGENYASDVSYWMPYCNNVGMHDASWRSSFGSNIYKTSGSHGCVNLPAYAAQKIFENIEQGDPVLVYKLPGTESPAAVAQEAAAVVNLINGIGEVTLESEPAIAAARNQYNLLSEAGQAQVPNYDVLVAAEAQLAALKAQVPAPEPAPAPQ